MKAFSKWTIEEVEEQFGVRQQRASSHMQAWLTVQEPPSATERETLELLRQKLERHVYDWNEQELIINFIGPLLTLVDFDHEVYHPFFGREISVEINQETLGGVVDFTVAQGRRSPKHPYFFIHEYKKEFDSSNDPLGQLLIAMVAAQLLNQDSNPIYGAYVLGRYWHFVLLEGHAYGVNPGSNASRNEILNIFGILRNTRMLIDSLVSSQG